MQSFRFHSVGFHQNAQVIRFLFPSLKFFYFLVNEFYILLKWYYDENRIFPI